MAMVTRRGNCINTKRVIGILAKQMTGLKIHDCSCSISKSAAEKVVIMATIEKKRVESPIIIFLGKDSRKSISA